MIEIERVKVKFLGFEPIVHMGGRHYEPGEIYEISYDEWIQVQGNGIFKLMAEESTSIEDAPRKRGRRKKEYFKANEIDEEIEVFEEQIENKEGDEE